MIIGISGKKQHGKDTVARIIEYLTDEYFHHQQIVNTFSEHQNRYDKLGLIPHWKIKKFADKLKDMVCLLINCTREQLEDDNFKNKELGEEWKIWYWTWYKVATDKNPEGRLGNIFSSEEQANQARSAGFETYKVFPDAVLTTKTLTPRLLLQLLGTDCGRNIIHPNIWVNATMADYKGDNPKYHSHDEFGNSINWIITDVRFPNEAKVIREKGGIVIRVNNPTIQNTDTHESETALDNHPDLFDYVLDNSNNSDNFVSLIGQTLHILQTAKIISN